MTDRIFWNQTPALQIFLLSKKSRVLLHSVRTNLCKIWNTTSFPHIKSIVLICAGIILFLPFSNLSIPTLRLWWCRTTRRRSRNSVSSTSIPIWPTFPRLKPKIFTRSSSIKFRKTNFMFFLGTKKMGPRWMVVLFSFGRMISFHLKIQHVIFAPRLGPPCSSHAF